MIAENTFINNSFSEYWINEITDCLAYSFNALSFLDTEKPLFNPLNEL